MVILSVVVGYWALHFWWKAFKFRHKPTTIPHMLNCSPSGIISRVVPNIRFVFALGPNSGINSYSVFGRIVAIGPNTNSDICFCVCGGHSE